MYVTIDRWNKWPVEWNSMSLILSLNYHLKSQICNVSVAERQWIYRDVCRMSVMSHSANSVKSLWVGHGSGVRLVRSPDQWRSESSSSVECNFFWAISLRVISKSQRKQYSFLIWTHHFQKKKEYCFRCNLKTWTFWRVAAKKYKFGENLPEVVSSKRGGVVDGLNRKK